MYISAKRKKSALAKSSRREFQYENAFHAEGQRHSPKPRVSFLHSVVFNNNLICPKPRLKHLAAIADYMKYRQLQERFAHEGIRALFVRRTVMPPMTQSAPGARCTVDSAAVNC